jgi:hypothetical protein
MVSSTRFGTEFRPVKGALVVHMLWAAPAMDIAPLLVAAAVSVSFTPAAVKQYALETEMAFTTFVVLGPHEAITQLLMYDEAADLRSARQ